MGRILILTILLFCLAVSVSVAEVPLSLVHDITLPDSLEEARYHHPDTRISDFDGDGFNDLMISCRLFISVYSIQKQEIIEYLPIKHDSLKRAYDYGYFDGDNRMDLVELVIIPDSGLQRLVAIYYHSQLGVAVGDSVTLFELDQPEEISIDKLLLLDTDGDGAFELYGKYVYQTVYWDITGPIYRTYYKSFRHMVGLPDVEILGAIPVHSSERYSLFEGNDVGVQFEDHHSVGCSPGDYCWNTKKFEIITDRDFAPLFNQMFYPMYSCGYTPWTDNGAALQDYWISDFIPETSEYELALIEHQWAIDRDGPYDQTCSVGSYSLVCFEMTEDTLTELWRREVPYTSHVFADERFPKMLFTTGSFNLQLFDITTFEVVDQTQDLEQRVGEMIGYSPLRLGEVSYVYLYNGVTLRLYRLDLATGIEENELSAVLPTSFELGNPYPNPFNAELNIPLNMPTNGQVKVELFDLLGRSVAVLQDGTFGKGSSTLHWDASAHPSGLYFIKATSGDQTITRKAMLLK